ncbi:MAG: D-aminoacyl-tRNA deacylase [Bacteroidetes bacterium]|nr:D-aminoacyl-tRNA deacylase [Rhodothermia bacterium]MCS7154577.1 D-aminoacyl-tRNA deacylase [Bacteroidota bacterium]MCX7906294.1 D-aminoacyl-tRNA deacylase [Bacteroidota bacterium]MDW8137370.1 D-aminoacyl-tRNA deacylase [Bacteroidota bacterium]MDW8285676.1 D-aminoacyl-tRNA deacylase [Bacteroidota bacterium]
MRALLQRVRCARVRVEGREVAHIGTGLLIFLAVHAQDGPEEADWLARKCAGLRIFPDAQGRMNRSLRDVGGEALVVSQFTLYGELRKGFRPSFTEAAPPERAIPLYERFIAQLEAILQRRVPTGVFGAMMEVELLNDGPVTIWLEKAPRFPSAP